MKILIVDNTLDVPNSVGEELCRCVHSQPGMTVTVRRAPEQDLPKKLNDISAVVLSGSRASALETAPWIQALQEFTLRVLERQIPLLGICFGHQTLARVLGGVQGVGLAAQPEHGWTELTKVQENPLTQGLPEKFYSFSSHYEEVKALPPKTVRLVESKNCAIQGFQLEDRPVFGIQFHPEKDLSGAQSTFLEQKQVGRAQFFSHAKEGEKYFNPHVSEMVFKNFLRLSSA